MDQQTLKNVLDMHRLWVAGDSNGKRADLRSADLYGADLYGANLRSADLYGANLYGANLRSADLSGADLYGANLRSADLYGANLYGANLRSANLRSADLYGADLRSADLRSADLYGANLRSADLYGANLRSADLRSADLRSADLHHIKEDFFARLKLAKEEVKGLHSFLMHGKIDGTAYTGECACFVGSVAKLRKEEYRQLTSGLKPDASSLTEKWFLGIAKGDIPQSNPIAKITEEWIQEFAKENEIQLPKYRLVSSEEFPTAF